MGSLNGRHDLPGRRETQVDEAVMTFLKRILGIGTAQPAARVRICPECGMAVAEHKDWCSILRARQAKERRETGKTATA
jgi:hypothetical protein